MTKFLPFFVLLFISNKNFGQVNLNSGLIAYYPFNGNANDASGNGNNAVFNNATLTSDRFGSPNDAYYFNGIDNYIKILNSPSLVPQELSLCAIVKPLGFYTGPCFNSCIIDKGSPDYIPGDYTLRFTQAAYTGGNCNTFDTLHQNFVGYSYINNSAPLYTPYVMYNTYYCVVYTVSADSLKLYVDGNMVWKEKKNYAIGTNSQDLFLGRKNDAQYPFWFNGIMDEVRIYNRAINQQEVNALCLVTSDTVINDYTAVLDFDVCKNELIVADATKYNPGDTVLMIQMKGAVIDSANAGTFGDISNYKNSGNYEMNIVKQKTGNSLSLLNVLQRTYDIPEGKVQLVRVPYYQNITLDKTLTCLPWDGSKGGILVLNVANTTTLNADIDVTGKGFTGGNSPNPNTTTLYCGTNGYYYPVGTNAAADKGESIANIGDGIAWGKGSPANGGGGGNGHNSGGGGGSNGGAGGLGGYQLDACGGSATDNRGLGGKPLTYNNAANKIFMGGGGGSGQTDNVGGSPMNGGNGGGIIIIKSPVINAGGFRIMAKGGDAPQCSLSPIDLCHDGSGGGGGAGSVLIDNTTFVSSTAVDIRGGKGGDLAVYFMPNATSIGPGGGGGGGIFWTNSAALPSNIVVNATGGINGVIIPNGNDPYGTTPGQAGSNLFSLKIPVDTILFNKNIDSLRIKDSLYNCNSYGFKGVPFTKSSPIVSWVWDFGDGTTAATQNTSHTYATAGTFTVKLVGTDVNGCKDSILKSFTTSIINVTKRSDTSLCGISPVQLIAGGGASYVWTPAATLNNPNISNPVATPLATTVYKVTVTNADGCSKMDSVKIIVNSLPVISKSNDTAVCNTAPVQLLAGGGVTYLWAPASTLNNPDIFNPLATPAVNTTYYVTVTNAAGCAKMDSVKISLKASPVVTKSNDTSVCLNSTAQLLAGGGSAYSWAPAASLNNPNINNPVATPLTSTIYRVTVTNAVGCTKTDSIKVTVNNPPVITKSADRSVCINSSVQLSAGGGSSYSWTPVSTLDNPSISSPVATPSVTTTYFVTVTSAAGCSKDDSIRVTVNSLPVVSKSNDSSVCLNSAAQLFAGGGASYSWAPASTLNNPNIFNPVATPSGNTTYYVTVTNAAGCSKMDSVKVNLKSSPVVIKSNDTSICLNSTAQLFAGGGSAYSWAPSATLNNPNINNPVASPLTTTTYRVIVTNAVGCTKMDSVKITVNSLPVITKSGDKGICNNAPAQLMAGGGSVYSWTPVSTLNNPDIANPVATPASPTTYYVTVTNAAGCSKIDSIKISTSAPPVITKSNDTDICKNTSVQLFAGGGATYSWAPASSLDNAGISNPVSSPGALTTYYVVVTNAGGCSRTDSVRVGIYPVPVITISKDTAICNQTSTALFVTGGSSYLWSPASSLDDPTSANPVASPLATTLYKVAVTDTRSCNYEDSVKVNIRSAAVFSISPDASVCSGIPKQLLASGGDSYVWSPAGGLSNPNISNPVATINTSVTYSVIIHENTCNETGILTTNLAMLPSPLIRATSSNDLTCSLGSSQLIATGATSFIWSPTSGLNNSTIPNPVASPTNTILYHVIGKDANGCSGSDTVTVKVNYDIKSLYLMPNSFSPNNDGINDCFGIKYWGVISELDFSVYNRFGEKVFHTTDPAGCWDGRYKQKPQDPNVFVYIIKAKTACGNIDRKGIVTLIR